MSDSNPQADDAAVRMTGITISFPGVKALDGVDLVLRRGEVHALMGENGAGKSTLIKALTGVYRVDSGGIQVDGRELRFDDPSQAQAAGISTVYQEVNLCTNLTVAENVMLGHEVRRGPFVDWRATRREARRYLQRLHLDIDPRSPLAAHSIAVQQLCAIARALVVDARVLILDEPTSSLDKAEVAELFRVVRTLRDAGVAILFVSHFLEQVYALSDRMTVLRNGRFVGEFRTADLSRRDLISHMVGRSGEALAGIEEKARAAVTTHSSRETPLLTGVGIGKDGSVEPFDLDLYPGEIVGFAGLLGSGRTEAARLLTGADRPDHGTLAVQGTPVRLSTPLAALRRGIALSTEDRKKEGVIGDLTVRENIALALQASRGTWRRVPRRELDELVQKYMVALNINPPNPNALIRNLSGGNQQKVLLARWLATAPRLLVLDEPTRGIDIGAKTEIQRLVTELAADGMSVVFISSELEEVLRLSQRVVVMRDRQKIAEVTNGDDVTTETVLETIASSGVHAS
ncbi:sugar ABC transporter ATP-binding protein [Cellulomonas shaoxiangyii]|uniref:Sugar ABC transporter ATP-binding protein n=1 Tax=Cellulomonas shaoxiangyii TaxID=2566013 RepID=A0A4P7SEL4_9CELL|nr:sugar ABC transporter ATP-binding protein [Cellulomonas shaoxiangyii]QCB92280.1 sugar ABC transporter ATP-binding protein [Cellulomonas shaoxiangyii]TGY85908.1 sugar ABC transporter ATP-binding protein [Cellulomonas shaoxiangyii]